MKSHTVLSYLLGGNWSGYVEMCEFENLAELEKSMNVVKQDKDFMTKIYSEAASITLLASEATEKLNSVVQDKKKAQLGTQSLFALIQCE